MLLFLTDFQDQGVPSRSTSLSFNVTVDDVIEPPPSFTQAQYSASIVEGTYAATVSRTLSWQTLF